MHFVTTTLNLPDLFTIGFNGKTLGVRKLLATTVHLSNKPMKNNKIPCLWHLLDWLSHLVAKLQIKDFKSPLPFFSTVSEIKFGKFTFSSPFIILVKKFICLSENWHKWRKGASNIYLQWWKFSGNCLISGFFCGKCVHFLWPLPFHFLVFFPFLTFITVFVGGGGK